MLALPEDEALAVFRERGLPLVVDVIRKGLTSFGVEFDVWFSELSLQE